MMNPEIPCKLPKNPPKPPKFPGALRSPNEGLEVLDPPTLVILSNFL